MTMYIWTSSNPGPPEYMIELICSICGEIEMVPPEAYNQRPKVCPKCGGEWNQEKENLRIKNSGSRLERFTLDLAKSVVSAGYWTLPAEKAAGEILDLAKALIAAIDEEESCES